MLKSTFAQGFSAGRYNFPHILGVDDAGAVGNGVSNFNKGTGCTRILNSPVVIAWPEEIIFI
jgi:hypothetical protein